MNISDKQGFTWNFWWMGCRPGALNKPGSGGPSGVKGQCPSWGSRGAKPPMPKSILSIFYVLRQHLLDCFSKINLLFLLQKQKKFFFENIQNVNFSYSENTGLVDIHC